ncbi:MAG: F420-dependent biliverdin reductase [Acidimicrobiales bacterium]
MSIDPSAPGTAVLTFLTERHLAILTTTRPDHSLHACAVGFTYEPDTRLVRVICTRSSVKARNAAQGGRAVVGQVDGPRWLSLEGSVRLRTDAEAVEEAVRRYGARYRPPSPNPERVVVEIEVERILGRA